MTATLTREIRSVTGSPCAAGEDRAKTEMSQLQIGTAPVIATEAQLILARIVRVWCTPIGTYRRRHCRWRRHGTRPYPSSLVAAG